MMDVLERERCPQCDHAVDEHEMDVSQLGIMYRCGHPGCTCTSSMSMEY